MVRLSQLQYLLLVSCTAALGGFLFGYDTAVISGAISSLERYFDLSSMEVGFAISSALLGCIAGGLLAGVISQKGRKPAMLLSAVLFSASALGTAYPSSFTAFVFFRLIGGLGVGLASMVCPMYISELSPARSRGRLVSINQLAIVLGIVIVYFVNYFIVQNADMAWIDSRGWRHMFLSELVPALMFFVLLLFVPESPRYLLLAKKTKAAKQVLAKITETPKREMKAIQESLKSSGKKVSIWQRAHWKLIFVGIMISVFQQVTGINAFLYYAPEIFKGLGEGMDGAMLQTVFVGFTNFLFTLVAIYYVDTLGRKPLLIGGSVVACICLVAAGILKMYNYSGILLLLCILGYIAAFAASLGPMTWVLLSELFPLKLRSQALGVAVAAQWIANFVVSQTFPMLNNSPFLLKHFSGAFPFLLYASMCLFNIIFVMIMVPETKGKSLEEIETEWNQEDSFQISGQPVAPQSFPL